MHRVIGQLSGQLAPPIPVDAEPGPGAAVAAIQVLRAALAKDYAAGPKSKFKKGVKNDLAGESVVLSVSAEGLSVVDTLSGEHIMSILIPDIIYTSVAQVHFIAIESDWHLQTLTQSRPTLTLSQCYFTHFE